MCRPPLFSLSPWSAAYHSSYLLDHDGEGSQHLKSPCKIHDIAPAEDQSKGHGDDLSLSAHETHDHGHQDHAGICDAAEIEAESE